MASAVGLAYYGYSYTAEVSTRERALVIDTMRELAEEKVVGIESQLIENERKLFSAIEIEPLSDLGEVVRRQGAAVASVFVLDDALQVIPGGYVSVRAWDRAEGIAFRELFITTIVPSLGLTELPLGTRGHVHGVWAGRPHLFSFVRRRGLERDYYIVLEADLSHLVGVVFPQFFGMRTPRLYQVVDASGELVYGFDFILVGVVVEQPFVDTVDQWRLRVAQRDAGGTAARGWREVIDFVLIGLALTVIVSGLAFLMLAIRRERRANELKSEFISNVSHELKTPLSIISMFGELLASGRTKSAEQAAEYADIVWKESVRLARLIDNVLDFAKIEKGVDVYEFATGDVGQVVSRALELVGHRLSQAGLTLELEIEPGLPEVEVDANALTLAVLNLVDNALKYAVDGKRLVIRLRGEPDRVVIEVQDFGQGIPLEDQERIFDRFYRARAVRLLPIRGAGIGLALVEHIARAHRGGITVESQPGQGATFRLWLPRTPPPRRRGDAAERVTSGV